MNCLDIYNIIQQLEKILNLEDGSTTIKFKRSNLEISINEVSIIIGSYSIERTKKSINELIGMLYELDREIILKTYKLGIKYLEELLQLAEMDYYPLDFNLSDVTGFYLGGWQVPKYDLCYKKLQKYPYYSKILS